MGGCGEEEEGWVKGGVISRRGEKAEKEGEKQRREGEEEREGRRGRRRKPQTHKALPGLTLRD